MNYKDALECVKSGRVVSIKGTFIRVYKVCNTIYRLTGQGYEAKRTIFIATDDERKSFDWYVLEQSEITKFNQGWM